MGGATTGPWDHQHSCEFGRFKSQLQDVPSPPPKTRHARHANAHIWKFRNHPKPTAGVTVMLTATSEERYNGHRGVLLTQLPTVEQVESRYPKSFVPCQTYQHLKSTYIPKMLLQKPAHNLAHTWNSILMPKFTIFHDIMDKWVWWITE